MEDKKIYSVSDYAKLKGVTAGRISQLKNKLMKQTLANKWAVVDCSENDRLFQRPAHNRKIKK